MRRKGIDYKYQEYVPRLRGPGKRCSDCEIVHPIANFNRLKKRTDGYHSHCKRCVKAWNDKKENKQKKLESVRQWRFRNRDKCREHARRCRLKKGKELDDLEHKLRKIRRDDERGFSGYHAQNRTMIGRLKYIRKNIKRRYGIKFEAREVIERFINTNAYRVQFRKWKASGFKLADAPCVYPKNLELMNDLQNFEIVRYGYIREIITKRAWNDGRYPNNHGAHFAKWWHRKRKSNDKSMS